MLQLTNGAIQEVTPTTISWSHGSTGGGSLSSSSGVVSGYCIDHQFYPHQTYWHSYPVYICSDKTKKAIEVLKALQAEKILKCESVPRFIELVETISNIL